MTTRIDKSIVVNVPCTTAYNQWTQFEEFPEFMGGVERVTQLSDDRLEWVAEIAGVHREWTAQIVEQEPDQRVEWAATGEVTNRGTVTFQDLGPDQTRVNLMLEYEPEGFLEQLGDKLDMMERQAEKDLEHFKEFIESRGSETGAWRGEIQEGGLSGSTGMTDTTGMRGTTRRHPMTGTEYTDTDFPERGSGTGYSGSRLDPDTGIPGSTTLGGDPDTTTNP